MAKKKPRPVAPPFYSAVTIAHEPVCSNIPTLEKCLKLVKEYQRAHDNPMCKIYIHEVVKRHLDIVKPFYGDQT